LSRHKDLEPSIYLQQAIQASQPTVSYTNRKDLIDYLTKKTSSSKNISLPTDANVDAVPDVDAMDISDERIASINRDRPIVKSIFARERVLSTRKSILSIKGAKV
jgi:hypothetical protein